MKKKVNEATSKRPQGDRVIDDALVTADINLLIKQLKNEQTWQDGDRNAITIFKTDGLRIVLTALRKGAEMKKHKADGLLSLQVLKGRISFTTDEQAVECDEGRLLTLHPSIPHDVLAKEETVFLLTLTTTSEGGNSGL